MSRPDSNLQRPLLSTKLPPILGIFLTVLIDLLGFGLVLPDLQIRGHSLGADGVRLGLALGVFSLAQLLTAPFLGRLSDVAGRRRVLMITTLLAAVAYVVYAHAECLWLLILSRAIAGVAAANLGVAFAYIADITKPEDRAKGLGVVGAAFGIGFIMGPPLGAFLVTAGGGKPLLLGYASAFLALVNFLYVLLLLPESVTHVTAKVKAHYLENFRIAFTTPGLALLLCMFFAANFGFTNLETTFFLLLSDSRSVFHLSGQDARHAGAYILSFVGVVAAIQQGMVVRRLVPKLGEARVLRYAYLGLAPALILVPFAPLWVPALAVTFVLGVCNGLAQPSLSSLVSRNAPRNLQGGIFGVTQGLGALARFIGPLISNTLFFRVAPWAPYVLGAIVIVFPAIAAWRIKPPSPDAA